MHNMPKKNSQRNVKCQITNNDMIVDYWWFSITRRYEIVCDRSEIRKIGYYTFLCESVVETDNVRLTFDRFAPNTIPVMIDEIVNRPIDYNAH